MNSDFPRIITLLRKERGISQKEAAMKLNVSQALLSHYEKGIRECGLDFVVRVSDFYDVSCDYLLGRSPERTGAKISYDDIPDSNILGKENTLQGSILPTLNKKLIINSLNIIFEILKNVNDKDITNEVSKFINLAVYRIFRIIYESNSKNEATIFTVPSIKSGAGALAAMAISEAECIYKLSNIKSTQTIQKLYISSQILADNYPLFTSSLLNLITNAENVINHEKNSE